VILDIDVLGIRLGDAGVNRFEPALVVREDYRGRYSFVSGIFNV
jgi:hypothetical protein